MYITASTQADYPTRVTKVFLFVRQQFASDHFWLWPNALTTDSFTYMTCVPHVNGFLAKL